MPARSDTNVGPPSGRIPDATVRLADGRATRLSRLWEDAALVLVFLRHFG